MVRASSRSTIAIEQCLFVLAARTKSLAPLIKVQPFTDKGAKHWLDEFDGDAADSDELVGFCTDTLFSTNPAAFHKALGQTEIALDHIKTVQSIFPVLAVPAEMKQAAAQILDASVTKLEGQTLGVLSELLPKPVKLKREIHKLYDGTAPVVWVKLHPLIQEVITKYSPSSSKNPRSDLRALEVSST